MPCNSDYMNPTDAEKNASAMFCFLDELDGRSYTKNDLRGYHPKAYNNGYGNKAKLDELTATLCSRLQGVDISKYSLELQIWWRDHQAADKARVERDLRSRLENADREAALAKLTPYERKLLGLSGPKKKAAKKVKK